MNFRHLLSCDTIGSLVRIRIHAELFPHIDLEYYVFLDLTKNSKSDVDERGHRLRFFHTPRLPGDSKMRNNSTSHSQISILRYKIFR